MLKRYWKSTSGQGMSEYLVLVLFIAVGSIAASKTLGKSIYGKLHEAQTQIEGVNFTDSHTTQAGDERK